MTTTRRASVSRKASERNCQIKSEKRERKRVRAEKENESKRSKK